MRTPGRFRAQRSHEMSQRTWRVSATKCAAHTYIVTLWSRAKKWLLLFFFFGPSPRTYAAVCVDIGHKYISWHHISYAGDEMQGPQRHTSPTLCEGSSKYFAPQHPCRQLVTSDNLNNSLILVYIDVAICNWPSYRDFYYY